MSETKKRLKQKLIRETPYFFGEDNFKRVATTYAIAAFLITPLFIVLTLIVDLPRVYFYIALSYTLMYPVYTGISWFIQFFRNKLSYLFIFHYFIITTIAFISLYDSGFNTKELFCFLGLYSVGSLVIVRLYPSILYAILNISLFIYGLLTNNNTPQIPELFIFGLILGLGIIAITVQYARNRYLQNVRDYSMYLKNMMDYPGVANILVAFNPSGEIEVLDANKEISHIIKKSKNSTENYKRFLKSVLSDKDLKEIRKITYGRHFRKNIQYDDQRGKLYFRLTATFSPYKRIEYYNIQLRDITKERQEEERVLLSERKYKKLYNANKAGVFTLNTSSKIIDANDAFFDMFDRTLSIGKKLFPDRLKKDWEFVLDTFGKRESTQNYQTQYTLENGAEKSFIFSWYFDPETELVEGSVIDLTNTQKAAQALKQSEEKYRLIFEESNDAIFLLDGDKIVDANLRALQLFGIPRSKIIGIDLYALSANQNEGTKKEYNLNKESLGSSRSVKFNWLFTGKKKIIEARVALIEMMFENQVYYQCVIQDVTEQNQNLRAIQNNQQNLENILENTPEGILIVQDEKILYANPEIKKLAGNEYDIESLFIKKDQLKFDSVFKDHLQNKNNHNLELRMLNKKQEEITVDVTIVSTTFENKEASMVLLKDVSVQNTLAKEKLRAELAEETNKELSAEISERIKAEKNLSDQFLRMEAIFDSSSNTFLLILNIDGEISSFNAHSKIYFETVLKKNLKEGNRVSDYFDEVADPLNLRLFNFYIRRVGKKGISKQMEIKFDINDQEYWLEAFISPIYDTEKRISEISIVAHDISDKKKATIAIEESLKEKEILLKEIHHRVKNNLQVISSILNLQSSFVKDKNTLNILQESRDRIRSMAIIHESLYRKEDFSSINFSSYLLNLIQNLISSYQVYEDIRLESDIDTVDLIIDQAIPCGLLVNELVTNSLKYAWKEGEPGTITVKIYEKDKMVHMEIADDGVGLPKEFNEMKSDTLGMNLIETLVEQLDGDIKVDRSNGTKYLIIFENIKPIH